MLTFAIQCYDSDIMLYDVLNLCSIYIGERTKMGNLTGKEGQTEDICML